MTAVLELEKEFDDLLEKFCIATDAGRLDEAEEASQQAEEIRAALAMYNLQQALFRAMSS